MAYLDLGRLEEGCASLQWPSSWDLGDDCRGGRHGDCCDGCGFAAGEDYILGNAAQVKEKHLIGDQIIYDTEITLSFAIIS